MKTNIPLKNFTSFKIGGPARYFFEIKNKEDLKRINTPFFVLGAGTNILASDKGFKGLVIKMGIKDIKVKRNKIEAGAGVFLNSLVKLSIEKGLKGLEWASGIPGTLGGAIYGNAGAFSKSMKDIVEQVEVFDSRKKRFKIINRFGFGYRQSIFKKNRDLIIVSAILSFKKGNPKELKETFKNLLNYRRKNHPLDSPSAGSIFTNPWDRKIDRLSFIKKFSKDYPALEKFYYSKAIPIGFLIEKCGLKGRKIGGAQISTKHANFIVNTGKAKSQDVKRLIKLIKQKVKQRFNVIIKEEIQYL